MNLISWISNMRDVCNDCYQLTELIDLPTFEKKYSILIFIYCKCNLVFLFSKEGFGILSGQKQGTQSSKSSGHTFTTPIESQGP